MDIGLESATPLAPGATVLEVAESGGDASLTQLLVVDRGKVHTDVRHRIDYGEGFFKLERRGDAVTVNASSSNLEVGGQALQPAMTCRQGIEWPAATLAFDGRTRRFVTQRHYCYTPRRSDR